MDIGTLDIFMNYHKVISGPVDLSSVISRVLREENIRSTESQSVSGPKKPRVCSIENHPVTVDFNDGTKPMHVNDVHKTSSSFSLTAQLPNTCLSTSSSIPTVSKSTKFLSYSEPCISTDVDGKLNKQSRGVDTTVGDPNLSPNSHQHEILSKSGSRIETCQTLNTAKKTGDQQIPQNAVYHAKELASKDSPHAEASQDGVESRDQNAKRENNVITDNGKTIEVEERGISTVPVIEICQIGAEECEEIISSLLKANKYFEEMPKDMPTEKLREEQSLYLKKAKDNQQMEPSKETKAAILQVVLSYLEMKIVEIVKFAKQIPGFVELGLDDQAALVKESRTESALIGGMRMINLDSKVFSSRCGQHFTIDEMNSVFSKDFLEQKVSMSKKITNLCMSTEEETILRAISITFSDRNKLDNSVAVENIQNKLMTCLIHVIKKAGKYHVGVRLGQLFDVLVNLRDVTEVDLIQVKKLLLEVPAFTNRPVVQEFL